jgi:hypothetical protein
LIQLVLERYDCHGDCTLFTAHAGHERPI